MTTLLIAGNELLRGLRTKAAIITAVVAPLALGLVFGLLVSGAGRSFTIGVVDTDHSTASRQILAELMKPQAGSNGVHFKAVLDAPTARHRVDTGKLDAAVLLPAGMGTARPAAPITVMRSPDRLVSGQIAEAVAQSIEARRLQVTLSLAALAAATGKPPTAEAISDASRQAPGIDVSTTKAHGKVDPVAFYGASMAILFMFFTTSFAARSVLIEREQGTLPRVLASGASATEIVVGKTLAVGVLAYAGMLVVWAVTALGFGATWGSAWAVALLMAASVAAIGGVATFVAGISATERQADAATSVVTFTFAILGGNFVGPGQGPDLLRKLSLLTPNGWALRAFTDLSGGSSPATALLPAVVVLAAIGLVFGAAGLLRVTKVVTP